MSGPSSTLPARPFQDPGFGIYVHWPFCKAKCPYCDFNSHVRLGGVDQTAFLEAYRRELAWFAERTPERPVRSIFFGGGTPSLMAPETVAGVLETISALWPLEEGCEITLEANPTSADAGRFRGYAEAGVNRLSIGVQALSDKALMFLGRLHSVEEAWKAVALARETFPRLSFDLIYARPGQTAQDWREELETAIAHAADHLSLYQLTIEDGTPFEKLRRAGKLVIPDDDHAAELFEITRDVTARHGLPAYETSNHARIGSESRHNLVYWRYGDYAGIGPGAHGRLTTSTGRIATATERLPEAWLERVATHGHGLITEDTLTREECGDEFLLMGLRLTEGIDPARYAALTGRRLDSARIADLEACGMITVGSDNRLRATRKGSMVLDAVIADLAS